MSAPATSHAAVHDFVAVGAGPFNLGLAALADPVDDLDGVVLEARDEVTWHPGMLLPDSTLQVPFLGDLVSMADPTNRWSYLNWLKQTGGLYPFYIREDFHPLRREYSDYLRWAADGLDSVHLGQEVVAVDHADGVYVVTTATGEVFRGRRLVLGVGTTPRMPRCVTAAGGPALHSAQYLARREELLALDSVTVVGSGQSAAEVYLDLLTAASEPGAGGPELTWLTRSPRFWAMDDSRLTLEMTSPEYTAYFQGLDAATRERLLAEQPMLYKGISTHTIDAIAALHYRLRATGQGPRSTMVAATALADAAWDGTAYDLGLHHTETGESFGLRTQGLVLATGYAAGPAPAFLDGVRDRLRLDEQGRFLAGPTYAVDHAQREVFVQNAEEHTHGFVAPDLGMGAHRSSVLLNTMTGREVYAVEKRVAVQSFGVPDHLRTPPTSSQEAS
ncbi:lysine N(6)-hydroxylase/L-ornithine N(5)-oxygenase family protein [Nocardioides sp. CFH 31398]|uniref:lysine N(6)-hydroxylase/L-ornithine N(5)-oxygenase family protein n=1 Tax=Nocardioides sp. CFH 31398 TaxID=2919579 RepID=UPI001F06F14D|nr:SidA/IucD/PvdA family monooxygenase [Nocardioides sp. CFH 31398]MCH1867348.1 SidA/IucD/PvdA family monooxygenase [Nocardioides sp. CFH 31398]